jgi:hypothetical protein
LNYPSLGAQGMLFFKNRRRKMKIRYLFLSFSLIAAVFSGISATPQGILDMLPIGKKVRIAIMVDAVNRRYLKAVSIPSGYDSAQVDKVLATSSSPNTDSACIFEVRARKGDKVVFGVPLNTQRTSWAYLASETNVINSLTGQASSTDYTLVLKKGDPNASNIYDFDISFVYWGGSATELFNRKNVFIKNSFTSGKVDFHSWTGGTGMITTKAYSAKGCIIDAAQ